MTLAAGTRFGPYEIVAPLGAGGMGEVCEARDYDVSADGQRFLVNTFLEETVAEPITVVVNWKAGLKQ